MSRVHPSSTGNASKCFCLLVRGGECGTIYIHPLVEMGIETICCYCGCFFLLFLVSLEPLLNVSRVFLCTLVFTFVSYFSLRMLVMMLWSLSKQKKKKSFYILHVFGFLFAAGNNFLICIGQLPIFFNCYAVIMVIVILDI